MRKALSTNWISVCRFPICHARPHEIERRPGVDLDQPFSLPGHHDDRSIIQLQPVTVAQRDRLLEIEQQPRAFLSCQHDAPPLAVVGIEHDAVDASPAAKLPAGRMVETRR
jgi:hypothetical protein